MKKIHTKYRSIISPIPHPGSIKFLNGLRSIEPKSMGKSSPVVWGRAKGVNVYDGFGNKWIDFTSSVVLANVGHSNKEIGKAIRLQIDRQLFHNYCNPSLIRLEYLKRLRTILPDYLDKVFLLTTGSEAVECAIRVVREYGQKKNIKKVNIISHLNSFHGKTMASKALARNDNLQKLPGFHHILFPDCTTNSFSKSINSLDINAELVAGIIVETFRGPSVTFMPKHYVKELRKWTISHKALLIFDEIQAGFGRTGKWFGFEHYGVEPDLIIVGKGMTSSLPMSGVIGKSSILDSVAGLTSTHSGNPLCIAAGIGNIDVIEKNRLIENARNLGKVCLAELEKLKMDYPKYIGPINGKGLAMAFYLLNPKTGKIYPELASRVINKCMQLGLLLLPTGAAGTVKIAPPLCINSEALLEGIGIIKEAISTERRLKDD